MIQLTGKIRNILSLFVLFFVTVCLIFAFSNIVKFILVKTESIYGYVDSFTSNRFYSEIKYSYTIDNNVYQGKTIVLLLQPDTSRNGYQIRYIKNNKGTSIIEEYIVVNIVLLLLLLIPFFCCFALLLLGLMKLLPEKYQQRLDEWSNS